MRGWSALAVMWVASCADAHADLPSAPDGGAHASSSSSSGSAEAGQPGAEAQVSVHAVFDLPRGARSRTLSALTGEGTTFFALPDKDRRIVSLRANAECTEFEVGEGIALRGLPDPSWDGEGLARAADGSFFLVADETLPSLVHVDAEGSFLGKIAVPERYSNQPSNNKGLESLSLSPSGSYLFTSNESALVEDGPAATKTLGTLVRLLRIEVASNAYAQYTYRTEPLGAGSGGDMGVSDVLALGDDSLLVLERGYQSNYGNTIRLFRVNLAGARDVAAVAALGEEPEVLEKELVADVAALPPGATTHPAQQPNPLLDNYEALAFGPTLADGRRLLLLLSDDNAQASQVARMLVLAVRGL